MKDLRYKILNPLLVVTLIAGISYLGYFGARGLADSSLALGHGLAAAFGTLYFLAMILGPPYIHVTAYVRGASPRGRILAALLIPFLWMTKDVITHMRSHPALESLYWYLNPLYLWIGCLMAMELGPGILTACVILRWRGQEVKAVSVLPVMVVLIGLLFFIGLFAWGQGENVYGLFLKGYRLLFGSGV